jgi:hypothetical protein
VFAIEEGAVVLGEMVLGIADFLTVPMLVLGPDQERLPIVEEVISHWLAARKQTRHSKPWSGRI